MIDTMENKLLDISRILLKNDSWNGVLLFWGVVTPNRCGGHQPKVMKSSMHVGEMIVYKTGLFKLKTIIAVIGSFTNSLASCRRIQIQSFYFLSGSQNGWFVAVSHCLRPLCFNLKGGIVMSITNTKSENRKAIILLLSDNQYGNFNQQKISDCCINNNLEIIRIIKTDHDYDLNIFYELIEIINEYDQPITIVIGEYSYATYSQVMSCCILATLATTKLINICTYWEETASKNLRLNFAQDNFAFFMIAESFFTQLLAIVSRKLVKDTPYTNGGGQ